jgi:hypothetical protein
MPSPWTETTARYLLNTTMCPRCNATLFEAGRCNSCFADLSGPEAAALYEASKDVAALLLERQVLIDALPTLERAVEAAVRPTTAAVAAPVPVSAPTARPTSHISVQSVLAVAGAGLFAVAAIVFTFFNPDLTNFATRTTIIALVTLVFIGGAWLLARRNLQFSAEAIGALGAVFAALDVWAFSDTAPGSSAGWLFLGIGTAVTSAALLFLAVRVRIRTWLWVALVGIMLTPAFLALSADLPWVTALGWVAVAFAAIGVHAIARRLQGRFDSPLLTDRVTATVVQLVTLVLTAVQLVLIMLDPSVNGVLPASGVILLLAAMAAISVRMMLPLFWSYAAGAFFAFAITIVPFAATWDSGAWITALTPVAAAVAVSVLAFVPPWNGLHVRQLRMGGWTVALVSLVAATTSVVTQYVAALAQLVSGGTEPDWTVGATAIVQPEYGLAAVVAFTAVAGAAFVTSLATRYAAGNAFQVTAMWFAVTALVTLAGWSALVRPAQALLALGLATLLALGLLLVPRMRELRATLKLPIIIGIHALLLLAAVVSWTDTAIRVPVGAVVVAGVLLASRVVPVILRPGYVGVAYAYALGLIAAALSLAGLEVIAVLCITTAVASLAAIVATLTPWLPARSWYAVLIVTAVPFVIGVASVLAVRSGWTALSTGVTFALLLALVLTRREGMTRFLRTAAAALLVPALAVVVICLGAQVLAVSASPITLPVIAVIVAGALPATGLFASFLVQRGITEADARSVRVAIEIGSLVTGAVAVLLALVRAAAGIPTTFLVLLILGIGAIATAVFGKRRYGWPLAGAAWTGALWCIWALAGVTEIEPYLLPPALGLAAAGAFLVARGLPGMGLSAVGLFWTGLATATIPTLAILAGIGSGPDATVHWRAIAILGGSLVFIVLGALVPRLTHWRLLRRISPLRTPLLVMGVVAASAGVIQALRYGMGLDRLLGVTSSLVMVPVLIASGIAVALATAGGVLLAQGDDRVARSRALYVPAVLYLVIGPIVAIRPGWFPILTLLALTLIVLALMIVTTVRSRSREVTLPPVAFLFVVAWCTAVASWSERELRVEAYSLPLGFALLAVGIIAMVPYRHAVERPTLRTWPMGFTGSWRLLAPGILVILIPSVLATGTDPLTQRAILVIALALVAILIGNMRRLAAPFILGIIVLPIENIVVFAVQIGQNIGALPWWITLATAGAVLLVIAVSSERRVGGDKGAAARLRDLT